MADPTPPLLELHQLTCRYDQADVLDGLSFQVNEQEICCLLGPSGCGKTTALKAIAGFQPVHAGHIAIRGNIVSQPHLQIAPEHRHLGMVFQDYALFPHLNVADNVGFGLHRLSRHERTQKIATLLDLINLQSYAHRFPHELSGGQQQRVALARALAPEPSLILLDEPFSNLDAELRKRLSNDVRSILKQQGTGAVMVTHDQQEAFAMCDRIGVMRQGNIQQWDTPYNLYHQPVDRYVATFVGKGRFLPGTVLDATRVTTELGVVEGRAPHGWNADARVEVLLRPDDVVHDASSNVTAQVVDKHFAGAATHYRLQLASGRWVESLLPSHDDISIGATIGISLDADHLVAFPNYIDTPSLATTEATIS